jgi:N-acetylmuramoyl-L-alanine amidase
MVKTLVQRRAHAAVALLLLAALSIPASALSIKKGKEIARTQFENAERMREALNGTPEKDRSRREYQRVADAYRRVYYTSPTSSKADVSALAVAELLAEVGRNFDDEKSLRGAIGQYEFLCREYPGSKYRFDALFTIGQIYSQDLDEKDKARETFEEFLKRYPRHRLAADARQAIAELEAAPKHKEAAKPKASDAPKPKVEEAKKTDDSKPSEHAGSMPLVTGIRHWSTPDYTRVAIDLEQEVKYEAGRVPDPDRIFFDLHDTKLSSTLKGKMFEVGDGFLRRIRVAQFQKGLTRVVLEVDDVSEYSAFLLPNPYRLIIDIHGRKPANAAAKLPAPVESKPEPKETAKIEPATKPNANGPGPVPNKSAAVTNLPSAPSSTRNAEPAKPAPVETAKKNPGPPHVTEKKPPEAKIAKPDESDDEDGEGGASQAEVASLTGPEMKATRKPTSEPTVQVVAPRVEEQAAAMTPRKGKYPENAHQARPAANGERSLIRALGLKIGRIVVDAGHGGHDTGTIGPSGLLEKDLVLDVALRLGRLLEGKMGAEVVYTRDDDTFIPLETRTAIANQQQADLFISIHANSSRDASARGVETYYLNFTTSADALEVAARENAVSDKSIHELQDLVKKIALKEKIEESKEFASDVQHALYTGTGAKDKTLKNRGVKKAPFIVLIGANMPSILAEISFVSNPDRRTPPADSRIPPEDRRGALQGRGALHRRAERREGGDQRQAIPRTKPSSLRRLRRSISRRYDPVAETYPPRGVV